MNISLAVIGSADGPSSGGIPPVVLICLVGAALCGFAGWYIGQDKNRGAEGFWLGLLLGLLGVVVIACLRPTPRTPQ